jgi:hypothetical protein
MIVRFSLEMTEKPVSFTFAIASSHVSSGDIAQTLHVGRESLAFVKNTRSRKSVMDHVAREILSTRACWLSIF